MMKFFNSFFVRQLFSITWKNLLVYKTRVILTICGIFFGIVSVISTFTVNGNVSSMVSEELRKAGTGTMYVSLRGGGKLTPMDISAIVKFCPAVARVIQVAGGNYLTFSFRDRVSVSEFTGVETGFFEVKNMAIEQGRSFSDHDIRARVAIIGKNIVEQVFGNVNPIGRIIKVGNTLTPFRVVGVLKNQGTSQFLTSNGSPDDTVYIPMKALKLYLAPKKNPGLLVQASSEETLGAARDQITTLFKGKYQSQLNVTDPREEVEQNRKTVDGMVLSGIAIGILSLISGGIGIMNIMLVSVMQRRREIGLYKAVGFNDRNILWQFISESLAICIIGSIFGVIIGMPAGSVLSGILLQGYAEINVPSVVVSVIFSLFVGVLFGYLPAQKAARLDPVEALKG